jgi:hypothetical protein
VLDAESPEVVVEHRDAKHEARPAGTSRWRVIAAVHGPGTLLVGPAGDELGGQREGTTAVAAPGTLLRMSVPADEMLSRYGWRIATWSFAARLDASPPMSCDSVDLAAVQRFVWAQAPEHLPWVRSIVRAQIDVLIGMSRPDGRGVMPRTADRACLSLRALLKQCDLAFGDRDDAAYAQHELRSDRALLLEAARRLAALSG